MLRGIPRKCTQEEMIQLFESLANGPRFNFAYLPWDCQRNANMGFAFVNCVDAVIAQDLIAKIRCQTISFSNGDQREIQVLFAHVQGLVLNVAHYIGSSVASEGREHAPVIMDEGRRVTFQEAVHRFVPPNLIESQLREAELAKTKSTLPCKFAPPPSSSKFPGQSRQEAHHTTQPCFASAHMDGHLHMDDAVKKEILSSDAYASAWSRLNTQLRSLCPGVGIVVDITPVHRFQ